MEYNKQQYLLTWIIFGMVCLFAFNKLILLLNELFVIGGIIIDIRPGLLKYLKFISYGIIALALVFASIRILRQKRIEEYSLNYKKLRINFLIILGIGLISFVLQNFLMEYRIEIFDEYIKRHSIEFKDIYQELFIYPSMFWAIMFIYFALIFFVLTKKIEKLQMLTKNIVHLAESAKIEDGSNK